jgi:hypothetical protein
MVNINLNQVIYCSYSSYKPIRVLLVPSVISYKPICVLLVPAVDDGCRFGHHFQCWASNSSKSQVAVEIIELRC